MLRALAFASLQVGDVDAGLRTADRLRAVAPDWPSAHETFGRAALAAGETVRARAAFQRGP